MEEFLQILTTPYVIRAIVVGLLVGICASLLGVSLVLKRFSMIGDGLSHVGFGAYCVAVSLSWASLYVSIPIVIAAAFLLLHLRSGSKLKGDAAIALISAVSLAFGYALSRLTGGGTGDLCNFMFGYIYGLTNADVILSVLLSVAILVLYIVFYNKIFAITFDEGFAKATGINVGLYNSLIAILTAVTVVLGMRMMGSLLISAVIIFPAISSMRIFKSFKSVIISSVLISVISISAGIAIDILTGIGAGPSFVAMNALIFTISTAFAAIRRRLLRKN